MPPDKESCPECGTTHLACPKCGENRVSIDSITPDWGSLSPNFSDFAIQGETGEELKYRIVCWSCGDYDEERTLKIVRGEQPCGNYHPLPCGLDEDCPVPSDCFDPEENSKTIHENWVEEHEP